MAQAKQKRDADRADGLPSPPSGGPQKGHRLDSPEGELMGQVRTEGMRKAKRKIIAKFNGQLWE